MSDWTTPLPKRAARATATHHDARSPLAHPMTVRVFAEDLHLYGTLAAVGRAHNLDTVDVRRLYVAARDAGLTLPPVKRGNPGRQYAKPTLEALIKRHPDIEELSYVLNCPMDALRQILSDLRGPAVGTPTRTPPTHAVNATTRGGRPRGHTTTENIERALERTQGDRRAAATILGIGVSTIFRRISEARLEHPNSIATAAKWTRHDERPSLAPVTHDVPALPPSDDRADVIPSAPAAFDTSAILPPTETRGEHHAPEPRTEAAIEVTHTDPRTPFEQSGCRLSQRAAAQVANFQARQSRRAAHRHRRQLRHPLTRGAGTETVSI